MSDLIHNSLFRSIRGRVGDLVFYERNGKQCVRRYVTPHNPDTKAQKKARTSLSDAVAAWQALSPEEKNSWNKKASRKKRKGYNVFISEFTKDEFKSQHSLTEQAENDKETLIE